MSYLIYFTYISVLNATYSVFIVQAYQSSQYVVPRGGIFLGKWRTAFAGSSDGKMNIYSACALNTRYYLLTLLPHCMFRPYTAILRFVLSC
jgi:hypothetical protein